MITEVPNEKYFRKSGTQFLNIAWDKVIQLKMQFDDFMDSGADDESSEEYWLASQSNLATSLALAQQGIELLLKGKIAGVSPFLLIAGTPRDWPSNCHKKDVCFTDFRTIDSFDLPKVHDAVLDVRLTENFKNRFNALRKKEILFFTQLASAQLLK